MLTISLDTHDFATKHNLPTENISLDSIQGLHVIERFAPQKRAIRCERETKERYSHQEIFGRWCNINDFIDVPADYAFTYAANIFSLEEWTYSIRELKHVGKGIYQGKDLLCPASDIFIESRAYSDSRCVDYVCAFGQKEAFWLRHFFRFIDAEPSMNRPGTILMRLNCKHPNYAPDTWRYAHAAHKIEADNLRYILEHRYYNK